MTPRSFGLVSALLATSAMAWTTSPSSSTVRFSSVHQQRAGYSASSSATGRRQPSPLKMGLDYNDPAVAEEFAEVQTMEYDDVVEELMEKGIPPSPAMSDMDVKLMLVEVRMRLSGRMKDSKSKKEKPTKFSSKFEEAMWTKPAFEELYNALKKKDDHNAMNVASEYVNHPDQATTRYGKDYKRLLKEVQEALTAPPPVKSATLSFDGFPANMGEMGLRSTLEAVGPIAEFECAESEDFPTLSGKVTFEDIETAKKAVEQYNGMDMGMGTTLELTSV